MLQQRRRTFGIALFGADLLALGLAYVISFKLRFPEFSLVGYIPAHGQAHLWMALTGWVVWPIGLQLLDLYDPVTLRRPWRVLPRTALAAVAVGLVIAATLFLTQAKLASRLVLGLYLLISAGLLWIDRLAARRLLRWWGETASPWVLVVGTGPAAAQLGAQLSQRERTARLVGYVRAEGESDSVAAAQILGSVDDLPRLLEERVVDHVAVALPSASPAEIEAIELTCAELGRDVLVVDSQLQALLLRAAVDRLGDLPVLRLHASPQYRAAMLSKRAFDMVAGSLLLLVGLPLLLGCALLVKLTTRGPVLYVQERVGLNGRRFKLYKLRSMIPGAEQLKGALEPRNEVTGPHFKITGDPRVTPVGHFLRRFSLDELPQLINVLKGDMSLVGPRPPLPDEVARYDRWQRRRLSVRPGMTGPWQVAGRSELDFDTWMTLDLAYIDGWSPWRDLVILARTVPAVLSGRGAR